MSSESIMSLAAVGIAAGGSFCFALAEAAMFSLGRWQVRQLAEREHRAGGLVARLLEQPADLLATMVLGNTLANATLLGLGLWRAFTGDWPLWPTAVGLLLVVIFGCEVLPKTLAVRRPERWALTVAPTVWLIVRLTLPLRWLAQKLNEVLLRILIPASVRPQSALTDEDYQELLEMATQQGTLAPGEKEIILQIISLDQRTAREVMRPRSRMACIPDDLSLEEMLEAARKFKHRRLPMYDETPDTIVGILNTRALLQNPEADLADVIEFPSFVPESMNLFQLLQSLQRQKRGMAIVMDEFGGTAGLVTLEDILGELVGSIRGEVQHGGFVMEKLGPGRWRVNGTMRLDDFRREHPAIGEMAEVETMGGLLTHLLGIVPARGDSTVFRGLKLTAQVAEERRVRELLVEQVK